MRTHILVVLTALIVSACASKRDVASTQNSDQTNNPTQHAQMFDGASSRIR